MLQRFAATGDLPELDVLPWVVETAPSSEAAEPEPPGAPRSIRLSGRTGAQSLSRTWTIGAHPLWIGRRGCHVELEDAELSIRHCSISLRGARLVIADADSHTGTFLDGEPVEEAELTEGPHLIRLGRTLLSVEATDEAGEPVEPIVLAPEDVLEVSPALARKLLERGRPSSFEPRQLVLHCIAGPLTGRDFELPPEGVVVGREGNLRIPDEFLSRRHFELFADETGGLRIRDLGSRNGTFLNTLPASNTRVKPGDEIAAGVNRFRVEER
jgi:ABC transport system ATP-binding/permease protein